MRFKRFQRFLALATGLCLAAGTAAPPARAAGASPDASDSPDYYALEAPAPGAPLLAGARAGTVDSGTCGDSLNWTLTSDDDGWYILTIDGSGAMADYSNGNTPWSEKLTVIKTLVLPKGLTSIGNDAFYGCKVLTSADIPEGVKTIGYRAFYSCEALASVSIPEGVETIGGLAFYNCSKLEELTLPESVKAIGAEAFQCCFALRSVTIPEGVETIESNAFCNCGLTELTIPEGVKTIGAEAFSGCESLDSVAIPSSVTEIAPDAFSGCPALKTFTVDPGNTAYSFQNGLLLGGGGTKLLACLIQPEDGALTIPEGVEVVGKNAFSYCSGLTSVTFPDSLTAIGDGAFYGCSRLTSVSLPASLKSIGERAFEGCGSLETVVYNGSKEELANLCGGGGLAAAGFAEAQTFSYPVAIEENGGTGAKGAGIYKCGTLVTLTAGTKTGHTFAGWAVDGVTLTQEELQAETLIFTMPDGRVTASANWALPSADSVSQTGSTVKLTFPGAAPADGALVLAALDGTGVLPGTYDAAGSEVTFQRPLESGRKLFFLDPKTLVPLAKPAIVP